MNVLNVDVYGLVGINHVYLANRDRGRKRWKTLIQP